MVDDVWDSAVRKLLKHGYGVEDIAIMLNADPNKIREMVNEYRKNGRISEVIWRKGKSS